VRLSTLAGAGVIAIVLVAGCGGSATTPTSPAKATTGPVSATAAPASAPGAVASPAPVATPAGGATPAASTTGGGTADLCSLLTPADLKTATGKTYLAGTLDAYGQCNWNTDATGVNSGDLVIAALQAEPLSFIKSSFGTGGTDATVGGHAAFWNPTLGLQSMWIDVGGGNLLVLSFPRSSDLTAADGTAAQALAEIAVSHM